MSEEKNPVRLMLEAQYNQPLDKIANLVQSETPLTREGLQAAVELAKMHLLPLTGVNVIRNRRGGLHFFVNAHGIRWRLHNDVRGLQSTNYEIIHFPSPDEPYVRVKGIIKFRDGSEFSNEAVIWFRYEDGEWYERMRSGDWKPVNLGDRVMAAITKAIRRAGVEATGIALPIFEDTAPYVDASYRVVSEEESVVSMPELPSGPPRNLAELLAKAQEELGLDGAGIQERLGKDLGEIAQDVQGAWEALLEDTGKSSS